MASIFDIREGLCRYPRGTHAPYDFCCAPADEGSSYCAVHRKLCCRPPDQPWQALEGMMNAVEKTIAIVRPNLPPAVPMAVDERLERQKLIGRRP